MKMIRIAESTYIDISRAYAIMSVSGSFAKRKIKEAKKDNSLIDMTFGKSAKCIIMLDNNKIILVPLSAETINKKSSE